jgi:hypothetical protein
MTVNIQGVPVNFHVVGEMVDKCTIHRMAYVRRYEAISGKRDRRRGTGGEVDEVWLPIHNEGKEKARMRGNISIE